MFLSLISLRGHSNNNNRPPTRGWNNNGNGNHTRGGNNNNGNRGWGNNGVNQIGRMDNTPAWANQNQQRDVVKVAQLMVVLLMSGGWGNGGNAQQREQHFYWLNYII